MDRRGYSVVGIAIALTLMTFAGVMAAGFAADADWDYIRSVITGAEFETDPSTGEFTWNGMAVYGETGSNFSDGYKVIAVLNFTLPLNRSLPQVQSRNLDEGNQRPFMITTPDGATFEGIYMGADYNLKGNQIAFTIQGADFEHEQTSLVMQIDGNVTSADGKLLQTGRCTATFENVDQGGSKNWSACTGTGSGN